LLGNTKAAIGAGYQYLSENFTAFDRFGEVEFNRNWALPVTIAGSQHLFLAYADFNNRTVRQFKVSSGMLLVPNFYQGLKHDATINSAIKGTNFWPRQFA
jgi:hypothetical protein